MTIETSYFIMKNILPGLLSAIVTIIVGFLVNRKSSNRDFHLKEETAILNRKIAEDSIKAKLNEARALATYRYTDVLIKRHYDIQKDISELIAMLDMHENQEEPFDKDIKEKAYNLCSSIAFQMFPSGNFDEEFIVQLGHIREFFNIGKSYWKTRKDFYQAFKTNCWMMLNENLERIEKSIMEGNLVKRNIIEPRKIRFVMERDNV